ncbi:MAG: peptidase MA family metallohydrolase [Gemmatimonadales bacterium]|jgi:hypothetical protein
MRRSRNRTRPGSKILNGPGLAAVALILAIAAMPAGLESQEHRAGAVTFVYWPGQERAAAALAAVVDPPPAMPGLPPDILSRGEIIVLLAPNRAVFDSLAPGVPDWSGGIAFPEGDRIVLPTFAPRAGGLPLPVVLRHELAHVALSRYLGSGVPRWFHEGYAQLASGSWGAKNAWTLRLHIAAGRTPSLESLSLDFRTGRIAADQAYMLSYTAVEYLQRLGGSRGFARLLQAWTEAGDLDAAIRRTYGLTLGQFERMWRRDVARRFGWLLVLAQTAVYWTLLTIILLVMGYWKRRRDKRKLAALEAISREEEIAEEVPRQTGEAGYNGSKIDEVEPNE